MFDSNGRPPAPFVADADIIFLSCGFFYLLFLFSSPNLSRRRWMSTIRLSFCQSVCLWTDRLSIERLRTHFFTDFHQILHAAQKCGRFDAYCLWDKPEVVCRFWRCADSDFGSFQAPVTTFFNRSAPNPMHCGTITFVTSYGFRQILHADQKCDRFYVWYFGNHKPEVDIRF